MRNVGNAAADAAAQLMASAETVEHAGLKQAMQDAAKAQAAKARDEMVSAARKAPFSRVPTWGFFLPGLTRRQLLVLGRVYSFQRTKSPDGTPGEYRMSMANGARELNFYSRADLRADLQALVARGYVTTKSNGERKPKTYAVDETVCVATARANGWQG